MQRRSSVNINELINRFEVSNTIEVADDYGMSENVKYVKVTRPKLYQSMNDDDTLSNFIDGKNRSLMKYTDNDKFYKSHVKRTHITMDSAKELIKQAIAMILQRISGLLELISKFPFPRMSVMSFGLSSLLAIFICPRSFTERALYPAFRILFTVIYPAYRSFKAIRNKNMREYLKWIAYWIVHALFTCIELLTDAILSWFPFYYEIKVILWIWLLGPSTKGSMKLYKQLIHPTLISHEQEIDDIIQIAQERGYMHVMRLGSKSVNYANKIIMQEAKLPATDAGGFIVAHQHAGSVSNISDTETIQSIDDVDEILRLRKYAGGKMPIYGSAFNYSYEHLEQIRKPSLDFSSGYSSPTSPPYFQHPIRSHAYIEENDDRELYNSNLSRNRAHSMQLENLPRDVVDRSVSMQGQYRKASINELTEDEIIYAYNNLRKETESIATKDIEKSQKSTEKSDETYNEFIKWMALKDASSRTDCVTKSNAHDKVNELNATIEAINVVHSESEKPSMVACETENVVDVDDEFKDAISDDDDNGLDEYLKVPLIIREDGDVEKTELINIESTSVQMQSPTDDGMIVCNNNIDIEGPMMIPTVIESNIAQNDVDDVPSEQNTIEAKMTLSNAPLEVLTNLSSSSVSLTSNTSADSNRKRPARHSKGPAPRPPAERNEMPGHFYDHVTEKHFKETEL